MQGNDLKRTYKNSLFLVLLLFFFLLNISTIVASEFIDSEKLDNDRFYSISIDNDALKATEFDELFSSIVNDVDLDSYSIELNGKSLNLIELPFDSIAVHLPNDRIVIKYSNEEVSILPHGSNITYYDDKPVIKVVNQSIILKVADIIVLPLENITKTAIFHQSIERLNNYQVDIQFIELEKAVLRNNIVNYSIKWGDGTTDNYENGTTDASHIYKKSGSYTLTICIKDDFGFSHELEQNYNVEYEGQLLHSYLWVQDNKEPVAYVTSTSAGIIALGLLAFTETGKYKLLALLALLIPLYTRIQKEDVLDQFVRGQIYGYIKTNPGVHYNQIRRGIDVKNGTLSYHLRVLEKTELIKSRREGVRYRAFYPTGMKFPEIERFRLTELQMNILDILDTENGINQKEIARRLQKKPQTINYNIKVLEQAGLIEVKKQGRKTGCFLKENIDYTDSTTIQ
jgi:DNA-binding MarR family transcriptional regulator